MLLLLLAGSAHAQLKGPDQRGTGKQFQGVFKPSVYYSASPGPALPACSPLRARQFACVSDSTACIGGTTYASGGSTNCLIECNNAGTTNVETGVLCQ